MFKSVRCKASNLNVEVKVDINKDQHTTHKCQKPSIC